MDRCLFHVLMAFTEIFLNLHYPDTIQICEPFRHEPGEVSSGCPDYIPAGVFMERLAFNELFQQTAVIPVSYTHLKKSSEGGYAPDSGYSSGPSYGNSSYNKAPSIEPEFSELEDDGELPL